MNPTEIEFAVRDLVAKPYDAETFPYELIGIFNASKMTVSRLKSGQTNKARQPGDVLWQKHLFFRSAAPGDDVGSIADALVADALTAKHKPRFILVTNGQQVHARDLKFEETANVEFEALDEQAYFLLPLAGYERRAIVEEHPADIKAAKKLKKFYDAILAANPTWSNGHHTHELNLLVTRLLFCFYAEKTGIFETPKIFTNTVTQQTIEDGSDVAALLDQLFRIMNIQEEARPKNTSAVCGKFPYVNGSLFEDTVEIPQFSRTARRQLLECGDLDWTTINPDIFGSMIQTIAQDGTRSDVGMHYTSVPNIMKVLQPLFLDDLNDAYTKAKDSVVRLEAILGRLAKIRVFDPACGSGNFLVVAYKEMRKIEIEVLRRIGEMSPNAPLILSGISLRNFFGVDVVDFACETAKLSLWIAEYQMNSAFRELFGTAKPPLPLGKINTIHNVNALRADWDAICPATEGAETFLCGNPPYVGSSNQTAEQKADVTSVFAQSTTVYKNIDYVACWFVKASAFVNRCPSVAAFVATNSVCQGEQVSILWPILYSRDMEITFAYTSFKWENSASHNAGVTCIIVGIAKVSDSRPKTLFDGEHAKKVPSIGPYLIPGTSLIIEKASSPLNSLPPAVWGNKPTDGGNLILSSAERTRLIQDYPAAASFLRRYYGSDEVINSIERWCLWIDDVTEQVAKTIPPIARRIAAVKTFREKSKAPSTREAAAYPYRFRQIQDSGKAAIAIPEVSSEHRRYLQIALLSADDIASNKLYVVYDAPSYLFALLASRMHFIWAETVGGRLESRLQYSTRLIYNTLPMPELSPDQRRILTERGRAILKARARQPGKTLAWLYRLETMPTDLQGAHHENDTYIEECIYNRQFRDDTQRLEHLFIMYARLKKAREGKGTLFSKPRELRAV